MNAQLCSDERLCALLQTDDDSQELRLSAQHVEQCSRCQIRLEQLAAEPGEWLVVQDSLLSIENGETRQSVGQRPWVPHHRQRHPTAWSDAMARQLLSAPSHPEMLGRIGRYEVERLIGVGGMGVVFKAYDTELNRPVAVKVLAPYLAGSGAARKRFAREARAAAAVVHEHVVSIHNVETEGESPFLVMLYVAGESLQQRVDREGPLELCEILRIAMQTASGLAAAHAQGLVHRDVKPSNILLEQGVERALLTDFGLARASDDASLTHTGYHPGTPQYMSPEQARGDSVDARSDLFSLGSVIYAMCTGRPPFRAETNYGVLRRITDTEPRSIREVNPVVPDWLEVIVEKLLAKTLEKRFQSAHEVAELLEQCLAHVQQPTTVALPNQCRSMLTVAQCDRGLFRPWRAIRNRWATLPTKVRATVVLAGMTIIALMSPFGLQQLAERRKPTDTAIHELAEGRKPSGTAIEQSAAGRKPSGTAIEQSAAGRKPSGTTTSQHERLPTPEGSRPAATTNGWNTFSADIDSYRDTLAPFETRSQQLWDDRARIQE